MFNRIEFLVFVLASVVAALSPALAGAADSGVISVEGRTFSTWTEYTQSDLFRDRGLRCGTLPGFLQAVDESAQRGPGGQDCLASSTNPSAVYDPGDTYLIPVVFHILRPGSGVQGDVSDEMIQSQIEILNEDFMAQAGTPGANGTVGGIQFVLATEDPGGQPTTGIVRRAEYTNNAYFNDTNQGYTQYAWDTNRYLNIWTNTAAGNLGYVPAFPQSGIVGTNQDRVVILWSAVGRDAPIGPPYDQGRTTTHEVGHWIALDHTFSGGCASGSAPDCYSNGDTICDTPPELSPTFGCSDAMKCGDTDAIENYMNYTDDTCMTEFTVEQVRRMRCTLQSYRPDVFTVVSGGIFEEDFEGCGSLPCGFSSAIQ